MFKKLRLKKKNIFFSNNSRSEAYNFIHLTTRSFKKHIQIKSLADVKVGGLLLFHQH